MRRRCPRVLTTAYVFWGAAALTSRSSCSMLLYLIEFHYERGPAPQLRSVLPKMLAVFSPVSLDLDLRCLLFLHFHLVLHASAGACKTGPQAGEWAKNSWAGCGRAMAASTAQRAAANALVTSFLLWLLALAASWANPHASCCSRSRPKARSTSW